MSTATQPTLLLLQNQYPLSSTLQAHLIEAGYTVKAANYAAESLGRTAARNGYSHIVLDMDHAQDDGYTACLALRGAMPQVPILMVSSSRESCDLVAALDMGADGILARPFDNRELRAHLQALSRAYSQRDDNVIRVQDLVIERTGRRVSRGAKTIKLTQREYTLLEILALNAGTLVSSESIYASAWDDSAYSEGVLSVYIHHLRKKLEAGFPAKLIVNVKGKGYCLSPNIP